MQIFVQFSIVSYSSPGIFLRRIAFIYIYSLFISFSISALLPSRLGVVAPESVPTAHKELLATPFGMLLNELRCSPEPVLRGVLELLRSALSLDTGTVVDRGEDDFNVGVTIILYAARLGARVENYLCLVLSHAVGTLQNANDSVLTHRDYRIAEPYVFFLCVFTYPLT